MARRSPAQSRGAPSASRLRQAGAPSRAAASPAARGGPGPAVRDPVPGSAPDGLVAMREVQVACMGIAGAGGGTLFHRGRSRAAGEDEAGPGVAVGRAAEGGGAGMLRRSDHAQAGRGRAPPDGERRCFGASAQGAAAGLVVRHAHGRQHISDASRREPRFPGIKGTPAFVRAPEGNGCAERLIRAPEENLLWLRTFDTAEAPRRAFVELRETCNAAWLIERHGFRPPGAARQDRTSTAALAA